MSYSRCLNLITQQDGKVTVTGVEDGTIDTELSPVPEATVPAIMKEGIIKGTRLHVHLSATEETALNVGKRHGKPVVLKVNAKQMHEDGIKFSLATMASG